MNNKDTFEILTIPDDTSYWLVRADGGKYLDDYIENSFISIAHNQVTIESIHSDDSPKDGLKTQISIKCTLILILIKPNIGRRLPRLNVLNLLIT